jgi:hypothetical protein
MSCASRESSQPVAGLVVAAGSAVGVLAQLVVVAATS